jgi:YegS/Rv2252/BmrU family lipid kinase
MDAETVVIVNPNSAGGATGRKWPQLARQLTGAMGNVEVLLTNAPNAATTLTRKALRGGAKLVISVGGDGTHNEVANGFFEGTEAVAPKAAMGVIPAGTGGDFRRSFGWSIDPREAVERVAKGNKRTIDVGRLTYTTPVGGTALRHFVNITSFGIGGKVDDQVVRAPKLFGGKAAFAIASLRALAAYHDQRVKVSLDGGEAKEMSVTNVAVCNGQYFGGGMWAAPTAKLDDGLFDVTIWSGLGLSDFVFKSKKLYDGTHIKMPQTVTAQARKVKATSDEVVLLDVDGEQPGRLPASMELLPGALIIQG